MPNPQQLAVEGLNNAQAGRVQPAEQIFDALWQQTRNPAAKILHAGVLPAIYQSMEDVHAQRAKLEQRLQQLNAEKLKLDVTNAYAVPSFFAQYQGLNDRHIQELRANLYTAPQPAIQKRPRAPGQKLNVGIITKYFRDHTIGRLFQGVVEKLPREKLQVTALTFMPPKDAIGNAVQKAADQFILLPPAPQQARQTILNANLDVLYYADLGMDPMTYTLALSRLAPVQCCSWGHPVTSGLKTIDYFISAIDLEPENSDGQYTEKLVKLPDLAIYYYRPKLEGPVVSPSHFNLPADAHFYGCPQSLYKLHPEFDPILAGILRTDPQGILLLLEGQYKEWADQLMTRWNKSMPDVTSRIRFLPRLSRQDFLQLNALCHVLLDPLHFGGGNTTYEALALGTPIVTLPSNMLRGRLAYKMYRSMNMQDCIAKDPQHFIDLATQIATTPTLRETLKQKILTLNPTLFENPTGLHQLADFWLSLSAS
jgi:predicted O-linked N-acetylglucosamine transferase (SPINDLY family)